MKSSNDQRIKSINFSMTLDEKLAQLNSYWIFELLTRGELDQGKFASKLKHGMGQITRLAGGSRLIP